MSDIRCPKCSWTYTPGVRWTCAPDGCGETFDTFETAGRCPTCDAQFSVTWCPWCGAGSPHRQWYGQSGRNDGPQSRPRLA